MNTPIDQPSETMWCIVSNNTDSVVDSCNKLHLTNGAISKLKGVIASVCASCSMIVSHSVDSSCCKSTILIFIVASGLITCIALPSCSEKLVRSTSWRQTISDNACCRALISKFPLTRNAPGIL